MVTYSEPSTSLINGILRKDLLKRFLRETQLGAYGTATGGSTTTLIDTTKLLSSQYNSSEWVGGWVRISKDAGGSGAAPQGEIRAISAYAPGTGTITKDTGTTIVSGDEYELWRVNPSDVLDYLDQVLQHDIFQPHFSICTYVPDGDMEEDNSTQWTASGATLTKPEVSTGFGVGNYFLRVTPSTAADYAQSRALKVKSGDTYHLSALVRPADGQTARVALYTSAGVLIDFIDHDKEYPARVWKDVAIPASTDSVVIRLIGQVTTGAADFDEVCFFNLSDHSIPLPTWITQREQVQGILGLRQYPIESNILEPHYLGDLEYGFSFFDSDMGRLPLRLTRQSGIRKPLIVFGTRNELPYSDDHSDTKYVDEDFLVSCLAWRVFGMLSKNPNAGLVDTSWIQREYATWHSEYLIHLRRQLTRLEKLLANPETWGKYA